MYLKRIEMQGFKSFSNRTVLEFSPGIMGIVGPNGSGKSNIADAVRWVLGEQSARSLRGSNMQDVIFSGTESRKPQGYASVTLTIDNADHLLEIAYDEVSITRRVYRSGESEYLINGHLCRRKDIYELFYDTGVGKEGYSIIGQGQIERILSGKPEDRRELFDEAAGIVKFKKRRILAEKKLETEQQNLVRITDILSELEKQVGPLAKQSEKAKEYLRLKEELKGAEIRAYFLETDDLRRRLASVQTNLTTVTQDLESARREEEEQRNRYEALTAQIEGLDARAESGRTQLSEEQLAQEKREGRIRILSEQILTAKKDEEQTRSRMAALAEDLTARDGEIADVRAESGKLQEQLAESEHRLQDAEREILDLEEELNRIRSSQEQHQAEILKGLEEKADISAAAESVRIRLDQAERTQAELAASLEESLEEETESRGAVEEKERGLARIREELTQARARREVLTEQEAAADQAIRENRESLSSYEREYQRQKSKQEALINLTERYEGYGSSIRHVMSRRKETPGILGVVADLLHTEKRYETALETALGGRLQNIVTDSEETAKELIVWLKENRYGRVTFLPLTGVNRGNPFPRPEALQEPGALGVASDLVTTEDCYRNIASQLLGRILVADTIDHALAIQRKYRHSLSIVTLEGESLTPGGAMTGGSFRNQSNLLGRRREITELSQMIREASLRCEEKREVLAGKEEELKQVRAESADLQDRIHQLTLDETTASLNLQQAQDWLQNLTEGIRSLREELDSLTEQIESLRGQAIDFGQAAGRLEERSRANQERIGSLTGQYEEKQKDYHQKSEALTALRLEQSNRKQRSHFLVENLARLERERRKLTDERAQLEEILIQGGDSAQGKEEEISKLTEEIRASRDLCTGLTEEIGRIAEKKGRAAGAQKESFRAREALNERIRALDQDSFRLTSHKERLEENLEQQTEYLWTEYEMTPSEAEALRPEQLGTLTEVRRTVSRNKTAIRELGSVNVNAIEEYKETSERCAFLTAQRDDLMKARDSVLGVIRELEEGMRRQFQEKFEEIRTEFQRVFEELFGGGRATLELSCGEGEDILEAGILINAQPPGKKLQNMMQLSGGEKALTAIALLFAIQNLKPSPFCMLDEIEAALDEPNVARFADYLKRLKENTQFIVITHRRGTMEAADRLYGVTMQEKGISTLVSVDLTDASLVS